MSSVEASYSKVCGRNGVCRIRLVSIDNGVRHETVRNMWKDSDGSIVLSRDGDDFERGFIRCSSYEEARNVIREAHSDIYSGGIRRWSYIGGQI